MKSINKQSRLKLAKYLNEHLCSFGEEFENIVICPTCIRKLDLGKDQEDLSAGHILPEASGGVSWTLLCRQCNSLFGENQDKWFGEYLNILNNPKGTLLNAKSKSKYIEVNGTTVSGTIQVSGVDGGIDIFTPIDLNPPGKIEEIAYGSSLEVSVKIDLPDHENEIEVGYITAAYLMWFHEVGYNWVFQSSLDNVRRQILDCDRTVGGARIIDLDTDNSEIQGIGVIIESGVLYPCCVVVDKLVIFPAPSTANAPTPKNMRFESPCEVHFIELAIMTSPYLTLYDGYHVVVPDQLSKYPSIPNHAFYIYKENKQPEWLTIAGINSDRLD